MANKTVRVDHDYAHRDIHYEKHDNFFNLKAYQEDIYKRFGQVLRVTAVPSEFLTGTLLADTRFLYVNDQGLWSGIIIDALRQVAARIPLIKKIEIIPAATMAEANELVRTGQVTLNITPQIITPALLEEFAALAISSQPLTNVLLFRVPDTPECSTASIAGLLRSYIVNNPTATSAEIQELIIDLLTSNEAANDLLVVNSAAEYESFIAAGVPANRLVLYTDPIMSYQQLSIILNNLAPESNPCNIAFLGDLAITNVSCFNPAEVVSDLSVGLNQFILETPPGAAVLGWVGPKYAPKLWFALQAAFDAWICECGARAVLTPVDNGPSTLLGCSDKGCSTDEHRHKHGDNDSHGCGCDRHKHDDDNDNHGCACDRNKHDTRCVPYPLIECFLSPPPRLFSVCRRFIPDYAVHELLLKSQCVDVHPVTIVSNDACGDRLY